MNDRNHYLEAIYAETEEEQFQAYRQFLEAEMEDTLERMPDPTEDLDDEEWEKWTYEKGKLDCLRLVHGMVIQSMLVRQVAPQEDE